MQPRTTASRIPSPLKTHAGKSYLASRIVVLMRPHLHQVQPFAGGLFVLLARDPADHRLWLADSGSCRGVSEVVNDLDGRLSGFWRVLQDEGLFPRFARQLQVIPFSRVAWELARD